MTDKRGKINVSRWWQDKKLYKALRESVEETVTTRRIRASQDRDLFGALIDGYEEVTGIRPFYSQGALYIWDRTVGIWSSCRSTNAEANGNANYRFLWDLVVGIETVHTKPPKRCPVTGAMKEAPIFINIGPTQERRMDTEPSRTPSIHQPCVFDDETPGLIMPTRMQDGGIELRLWIPQADGTVTHREPRPTDYKRHFCYDSKLSPEEQAVDFDAECPDIGVWENYLDSLWSGDESAHDKKQAIEEFLGASLCGIATEFQRFCVFEGPSGSNGKSFFCKFIAKHLFQPDQSSASSPEQWGADSFGTIQLDNKLINLITEIPETRTLKSDRLKAIISGDTITANRKNQHHVQLKLRAGHIIACNRFPKLADNSGGMSRRLMIFRFNKRFVAENGTKKAERTMLAQLRSAVPEIRLRCLFAASDLMKNQEYTLSNEHKLEMVALQERSSVTTAFVAQCLEIVTDTTPELWEVAKVGIKQSELFKAYQEYSKATGHVFVYTDREFYKELENAGITRTPATKNGHRKFVGVRILPYADWGVFSPDELSQLL